MCCLVGPNILKWKKYPKFILSSSSSTSSQPCKLCRQKMAFSNAKLTELPPDLLSTLCLPRCKPPRFSLLLVKPLSSSLRSTELPKTPSRNPSIPNTPSSRSSSWINKWPPPPPLPPKQGSRKPDPKSEAVQSGTTTIGTIVLRLRNFGLGSDDDEEEEYKGGEHTSHAESNNIDQDQYVNDFQLQLIHRLDLWYLWSSLQRKEQSPSSKAESTSRKSDKYTCVEADHVVALAREALLASKEAASIVTDAKLHEAHIDDPSSLKILTNAPTKRIVRSTRLLNRQNKRRRAPETPIIEIQETKKNYTKPESRRKNDERFDASDPLRLFLRGPETTQLLTAKEEAELIVNIQELMRLQVVKTRLQSQFCHEPTIVEWAAALGISCQNLKSQIHCGESSREKLIYANFRMVVYIAKQYQGRGLSHQDLLQEGSMGLMRSVEKFKPQAGCRFATYAYWWIRQAIRKALFQHSRTIRLPENIYALLAKVYEAKKLCIEKGNHYPTKEDIAACVGITVERLERLLYTARLPLSMQQPIWMDQDTTFQEVTADNAIEAPDVGAAMKIMRQHIRNLLGVLNPRERKIIRSRFGMEDGKQKTLSEIGVSFGLSKERVRQLESRALYKLRQCLSSQGLEAYSDMLI